MRIASIARSGAALALLLVVPTYGGCADTGDGYDDETLSEDGEASADDQDANGTEKWTTWSSGSQSGATGTPRPNVVNGNCSVTNGNITQGLCKCAVTKPNPFDSYRNIVSQAGMPSGRCIDIYNGAVSGKYTAQQCGPIRSQIINGHCKKAATSVAPGYGTWSVR